MTRQEIIDELASWENELSDALDEIIEFVNIAEEAAMAELAAFGYWDATEPLTGREIFNEMHAVIGGSREMAFEPTESGAKQLVL